MNQMAYNKDAEERLIASILLEPRDHDYIFSTININHFYLEKNREVFARCLSLYRNNETIDLVSIDFARDYLAKIVSDNMHTTSNVKVYIKEMIDDFNKRRLWLLGNTMQQLSKNGKPVDEIINFINTEISDIAGVSINKIYTIDDLINSFGSQEAFDTMISSCIETGFIDFDKKIIVKPGDMVILAGRPSMGKTAFALAMAKNISRNKPVGFFSLEMRAQFLLKRLAISEGYKFPGFEGYKKGCEQLKGLPIYIDDASRYNLAGLRNKINGLIQKYNIGIVFIDYLTLLDPPENKKSRNLEVEEISREIKHTAKQFNIPIVVISQLSRAVEARRDKRPMLSDLRESGAIEQDADIVIFTYRPYKYGIEKTKDGINTKNYFELVISKQRDGQTGRIEMFYDENVQFFNNWTDGYNINQVPEPLSEDLKW